MRTAKTNIFMLVVVLLLCTCLMCACNDDATPATITPSGEGGGEGGGGDDGVLPTYTGSSLGSLLYSRYMLGNANLSADAFAAAFGNAVGGSSADAVSAAGPDGDGFVHEDGSDIYSWTDFSDYSNFGDYFPARSIRSPLG